MTKTMRRIGWGRPLVGLAAATVLGVAVAAPASAHVSLHPETVAPGTTTAVIALRVPNERADSATVGLRVQFPKDHPLVSATVRSTPGWKASITRAPIATPVMVEGEPVSQAIDTIEWTGGSIPVGEYQDFEINVGPIPAEPGVLVFPTIQTYDKGDPVSWIEKPAAGRELTHPAPTLTIRAVTAGSAEGAGAVTIPAAATTESAGTPAWLAIAAVAALALALIGLICALSALLRKAPVPAPAPTTGEPVTRVDEVEPVRG
jgi:uncharacterized protein YcnI